MEVLTTSNITPNEWNSTPHKVQEYIRKLEKYILNDYGKQTLF